MYKVLSTYILLFIALLTAGQDPVVTLKDTIISSDTVRYSNPIDGGNLFNLNESDTLAVDSLITDTVAAPVIEAPIVYSAEDSIIVSFDGQKVFLYGDGKVTYQQIELTADYIYLDLETREVFAEGIADTAGVLQGKPIFKDGNDEFESKTLRYNFKTKKGIIADVVTEQGEGFVHSSKTKKISEDEFILQRGKYTTCDAEHPHFYLHLSKAKVISNKKIITGPSYMVLEDFPIYFPVLPFGYFPNSPTYSSGILVPQYGEEANRGFFLRDGGYYWAANEYFDLTLRGDIYSRGSWASKMHTNYRLRYKFSGSFDFRYAVNIYGEKGLDTYSRSPQFQITWSHSQDPKANPNRTFSASVNFSTSGYDKQNSLSAENYLRTQKSSSISYTKKWENTPFNMSVNLRHSQNSIDTTITLSLPELTFSVAKIYPFRKKNSAGPPKWYQNFGFTYTANTRNTITAKERELFQQSLVEDWKNGLKHNLPISFPNFNLLKYINISPSISYNESWYLSTIRKTYDPLNLFPGPGGTNHVRIDTLRGFSRVYSYGYSLGSSTNIYGMFIPRNPKSRIKGIRHKISPSFSFSYTPDFGKEKFGFWKQVQVDSTGRMEYYDIFEGAIFDRAPSRGASGSLNLSVNNNLEMKIMDTKDTLNTKEQFKKVKIIDDFSFGTSYNLIADSLNLSPINIRARTTIKGISINMGGLINPYMTDKNGREINKFVWSSKKGLAKIGRLTNANLSFGLSFDSKKGQKEAEENKEKIEEEKLLPGDYANYYDFNVPWTFNVDYSFNYSHPNPNVKGRIMQTIGFNGSMSITDNWRLSMNTNYDIMAGEFSFTTFNVSREMHCWDMSFNFVPFGYLKSYSFQINAKSTMLRDLKLSKRRSHYDNF